MRRNKSRASQAVDDGELIEVLAGVTEAGRMRGLLSEILTASERTDLFLRWKLMRMLRHGVPQRRIATELGVSLCKITRGARVLKKPGSACAEIIGGRE
jgi:TrpR family trp operon transcriptional repressor